MKIQFNIRKIALITFALLSAFQIFLFVRYRQMGVNNNIFSFEVIVLFGVILFCYSIQKWNDLLNPLSLYFIFIFGFGYSLLGLSKYIHPFDPRTIIIISLSILSFSAGAILNIKIKSPFSQILLSKRSNLLVYYALIAFSLLSFAYEMIRIGYLPLFNILRFDVYSDSNKKLVSFVHYFAMLFAVIPSWTYILYKRKSVTKRWLLFIFLVSSFVLLNYLSRQLIVLFLIAFMLTYTFYNKLNYRKVAFYSASIIGVFFLIGQIRMSQMNVIQSDKNYSPTQFLNNMAGIKYKTSLLETTFTIYSSIRYDVLNNFVKKAKYDEYIGMGKHVFRPLISLTFLDRMNVVHYEKDYDVDSALATYAIDPYLDFGFWGVVIFGFLYGLISSHFYLNYKLQNEKYIISWSIIIFCLIMAPFMNYFSTFFVFLIWCINKMVI